MPSLYAYQLHNKLALSRKTYDSLEEQRLFRASRSCVSSLRLYSSSQNQVFAPKSPKVQKVLARGYKNWLNIAVVKMLPEYDLMASIVDNAERKHMRLSPTFVRGEGVYLIDSTEQRYLDAVSGTFNVGLGYGNPAVTSALSQVLNSGLLHLSSAYPNENVKQACQALLAVAPNALSRCLMKGSTGGSTATEQAIRLAWASTGRSSLLAFRGSHHGQTITTSNLSGMPFRRNRIKAAALPVSHVPPPDCYRCPWKKNPSTCGMECVAAVESALDHAPTGEDEFAAFIAEPILGAGGGVTPPHGYWQRVIELLKRRGILLVFDEAQTFGRTGGFFAAQYYEVEPDVITLAKGISGIGMPAAAAVLTTSKTAALGPGESSLTWGGSVLTSAAILATITEMQRPGFFESAIASANLLRHRLEEICAAHDFLGTVRGTGLMTGLEVVRSKESREPNNALTETIIARAFERRLIIRNSFYGRGSFLKIRPPLTISLDEVEELCDKLREAVANI